WPRSTSSIWPASAASCLASRTCGSPEPGLPSPARPGHRGRMPMWVSELWRYPVKSMAGEPLHTALLREDGVAGDRVLHVRDARGRVVTSRSRPQLLGLHVELGPDGEPFVEDRPWTDPWVARAVETAAGAGSRLVRSGGVERFDILPLLVATDGA